MCIHVGLHSDFLHVGMNVGFDIWMFKRSSCGHKYRLRNLCFHHVDINTDFDQYFKERFYGMRELICMFKNLNFHYQNTV